MGGFLKNNYSGDYNKSGLHVQSSKITMKTRAVIDENQNEHKIASDFGLPSILFMVSWRAVSRDSLKHRVTNTTMFNIVRHTTATETVIQYLRLTSDLSLLIGCRELVADPEE